MPLRNDQSRFLLIALLLLYLVARVLQLFAGRVPSLLIVVLHVIPPALFAVLHGTRVYRSRGILLFATLCLGVGSLFESVSLRTGFPFGHYRFTNLMGPRVFDLPILLALAYLGMGYLSWVLGLVILEYQDKPLSGRKLVLLPLAASFLMTTWDLSMEAVWADVDHAWVWRDGGLYFGVPISNFFGWFLTIYIFYQMFAWYLKNRVSIQLPTIHWCLAILFYAASAAGNLLVVAPVSLGAVFVDPAGKQWVIADILWASRLVSMLLMMPLALLAWVKAVKTVERPRSKVAQAIPSE